MSARPVRLFEIVLATTAVVAVNLVLLRCAVRQGGNPDSSQLTALPATTDPAPATSPRQGSQP